MRWSWVAVAAALVSAGCGSIGEPLPPALHIPQRVTDLSALEQGGKIVVQFTLPARTTENLAIRKPVTADLGVGIAGSPLETWAAGAKRFTDIPVDKRIVTYEVPAKEWIGKDVVIAVRILSPSNRSAGWSNLVTLSVVPPLAPLSSLSASDVAEGVRLTWQGASPMYRIHRREGDGSSAASLAETDHTSYTDTTTEYGKTYHYAVEGFRAGGSVHALTDRTPEVAVTPVDTWPPPVPAGVAAVVSLGRVELVWERSIAPDLAGYRIYRAESEGPFTRLGEAREGPSYSDRAVVAGRGYRYSVAAFDQIGNESEKSPPVAVQAQ